MSTIGLVYPIKNARGEYATSFGIPLWSLEHKGEKYEVKNNSVLRVGIDENKRFEFIIVSDNLVELIGEI